MEINSNFKSEIQTLLAGSYKVDIVECIVITKIFGEFIENSDGLNLEIIFENYDLLVKYKDCITNLDKNIKFEIFKVKQNDSENSYQEKFKFIVSNKNLLLLFRKTQLLNEKDEPIIGLPSLLVYSNGQTLVDIAKILILICGQLEVLKGAIILKIKIPNHILALAFSGVFNRLKVISKIKDNKDKSSIVITKSPEIIKVLKLIGLNKTAAQLENSL